jgi:hypothetical protein
VTVRRPDHEGAVVAVWPDGRILAVQRSYRANPSGPGGGMRRGEVPRQAAVGGGDRLIGGVTAGL